MKLIFISEFSFSNSEITFFKILTSVAEPQEENVITSRESCFAQPVIKNVINNTKNNFLA